MKEGQPSTTAEAVAFWRALEQHYPPERRILDDGWAHHFMTRYTRALLKMNRNPWIISQSDHVFGLGTMVYTLLRHRWMDLAFERAAGPLEQVLILGAGYDMRAFRLNFGDAKVFEIDHPATGGRNARKVATLGRPDPVHRISVDFSTENLAHALERAGFQKDRKSWFFWEGVSMYLPEAAVRSTLTVLSSWGCEGVLDLYAPLEHPGLGGFYRRTLPRVVELVGEPVDFLLRPEHGEAFARELGFRVQALATHRDLRLLSPRPAAPNESGWLMHLVPA